MRWLWIFTVVVGSAPGSAQDEGKAFLDILGQIHSTIRDLDCEFEGEQRILDAEIRKRLALKEDGLRQSFSGVLRWRNDRHAYLDLYVKQAPSFAVTREQVLIRGDKAELLTRRDQRPSGEAAVLDSRKVHLDRPMSPGTIFLVDTLKRLLEDPEFAAKHEGSEIVDGHPCEILAFTFRASDKLHQRFWIDMNRGGHALKREVYGAGNAVSSRTTIVLKSFGAGASKIWLPVSGVSEGFATLDRNKQPVTAASPVSRQKIDIISTTVRLNRGLPDRVFTIAYQAGTPVHDTLKRMSYEFGQQPLPVRTTREQAEAMLAAHLAQAEAQKTELSANRSLSPAHGLSAWLPWAFSVLGVAVLIGVAVHVLRRGA